MIDKLIKLHKFLDSNREYNKKFQELGYLPIISNSSNVEEKIISLLYEIANTQSQPKINYLSEFYIRMYNNSDSLKSFENFVKFISGKDEANFKNLFTGLKSQNGWGEKTAALFVKTIFHFHNGNYHHSLKIWNDVPEIIGKNDEFYLPVDAVIISIFNKLDSTIKWNFSKINKLLKEYNYSNLEIEIWDDLWFWGFITQKGTGLKREHKWNENKYWILKNTDKSSNTINIIKNKAEEFLKIYN
ncbi:hypothetical protein GGR32_002122 [Mesonia hippocampi]|uniref:Uncharacterized protein n=1 Tax=Mesonia hippocampi TaxID=1628250 RepID=A0A840EW85_9FLAO|nr:hypothetical protein [Mesonia hippocampi]MBB4119816.1 hypothetical protein [Mesonia hippocampi]